VLHDAADLHRRLSPRRRSAPPPFRSFLDLSTAQLPERLGSHGLSGQGGVTVYELPYGWLM